MRLSIVLRLSAACLILSPNPGMAGPAPLPQFRRNGEAIQLHVDGRPYIGLAGELHNSSPSSPSWMAPIWDKLARNHVNTVIGVASWEQIEATEGHFDFSAVDAQIQQARAHKMRLVLIWFGGFKNADSNYTPSWVRRDIQRFARVERDPSAKPHGIVAYLGLNPAISVFSEALVNADAKAFAALMRHIRTVDPKQTTIMVQVENEVGLLGDSRDRSAPAQDAWAGPVPPKLLEYLRGHSSKLRPELRALWEQQGARDTGSWAEVFGNGKAAEEVFMAWHFARYVERVAQAGAAEYALPMYTNAWLRPTKETAPGDYPSGGPTAHMIDVWKAAAPNLSLVAPDIYIDDFSGVLAEYRRSDNPIFIPEAKIKAGNLFVALGQFNAVAFSPFGIEDTPDGADLPQAYHVLGSMTDLIAKAQTTGSIRGFSLAKGQKTQVELGGYKLDISGPISTQGAFGAGTGAEAAQTDNAYGLAMALGKDEFLIVGRGINLRFSAANATVEIDKAEEGTFRNGQWVRGRIMNGDERYALFPEDSLRIIRMTLFKRP